MSAVMDPNLPEVSPAAPGLSTRSLARRRGWLRVAEGAAIVCLVLLIVWVYVAKAAGASEAQRIAAMEAELRVQSARVRLLRAEVARLENPVRLERLARTHLGMAVPAPTQDVSLADLPTLAASDAPDEGARP